MGILFEGFSLFSLVGYLLTVMVTISGCIQLLWGCCVCFELPFGHCVSSRAMFMGYSPGHGLIFVVLASTQLVMGWPLRQGVCFMVIDNTWGLHFHLHCYKIGPALEKHESYASVRSWYLLLSSEQSLLLCIVSYPTWCWTVTLLHELRVIKARDSTVLVSRVFYLMLICPTSSLPVFWWPSELLIISCVHGYRARFL